MNNKRKRHPFWQVIESIFGLLLGIWIVKVMRGA